MWSAPIRAANPGSAASGTRPPVAGSPRMSQIGMPSAAGSADVGEAAVPVAVLEEDGPRRLDLELGQRLGLGADVVSGPGRVEPPELADGRVEVRIGHLGRVRGHLRDVARRGSPADRAGPASRAGCRRSAAPPRSSRPSCDRRPGASGTSRPVARIQAATSAALSRNRWCPVQWPVWPWPGRSGATTCRPDAASAGPTRHQIRADAVMPWMRTSGRSDGSPQASDENGMPAATVTDRFPGSTASAGASRTAATARGRSDMPGRYEPAAPRIRATWLRAPRPAASPHLRWRRSPSPSSSGSVPSRSSAARSSRPRMGCATDFPPITPPSRLALEREWGPAVYDNAWFSERSRDLTGGEVAEIYRPNTPMMSLLALPIAWIDVAKARRVWLVVDLALDRADARRPVRRASGVAFAAARGRAHRPVPVVGAAARDRQPRAGICLDACPAGGGAVGGGP